MIAHTKAFATYRELSQAHLDFVVLVCYAVPALRPELTDLKTPILNKADHFKAKNSNPSTQPAASQPGNDDGIKLRLTRLAASYQEELSRTVLITIFSYFESYIRTSLNEIAEFHGGNDAFKALARKRSAKFIATLSSTMERNKRKLQEHAKGNRRFQYDSYSNLLDKSGFRFPTELLAHYGVVNMLTKANDEKSGMRAWEIPNILADCLLFPISTAERTFYEKHRSLRNEIAHGGAPLISLKDSLKFSSALHALAAKIDRHIVEHFFVLQRFV